MARTARSASSATTKTNVSRDDLRKLWQIVMPIFKGSNFEFILYYGTLIGYSRHKDFLPFDDDIDLILSKKFRDPLLELLKSKKRPKTIIIKREERNLIQLGYKGLKGVIDVYFYEDIWSDQIVIPWDGYLIYPKLPLFPLHEVDLHGIFVYVPHDIDKILEITYGDSWNSPTNKTAYVWRNMTKVTFLSNDPKYRKKAFSKGRKALEPPKPIRLVKAPISAPTVPSYTPIVPTITTVPSSTPIVPTITTVPNPKSPTLL